MIPVGPREKRRGRAPKGTDPIVGIRMSAQLRARIEAWAFRQKDMPTLSAAIRQLVEKALAGGVPVTIRVRAKAKKDGTLPATRADLRDGNIRGPLRSDRWRVRRPRRSRDNRDSSGES